MAAICLGFHPSFTMKKRRGRRWWTYLDVNVCILIYCPLLTLRARSTHNFMEWICGLLKKATLCSPISAYKEAPWLQREEQFKSFHSTVSLTTIFPPHSIYSTHFSWFQKSAELKDMFTFHMQAYFPNIILPALETEAQLSGNRPNSHHLNSIH